MTDIDILLLDPQNIEIFRNDDKPLTLTVKDEDENLVDISLYEIRFTARENIGDAEPLFQRRNDVAGGVDTEIKVISTGIAEIYIIPTNTTGVVTNDKAVYRYDVELISPAIPPIKTTVRRGKLTIFADITR